jgi:hypothetical protein
MQVSKYNAPISADISINARLQHTAEVLASQWLFDESHAKFSRDFLAALVGRHHRNSISSNPYVAQNQRHNTLTDTATTNHHQLAREHYMNGVLGHYISPSIVDRKEGCSV